MNSKPNLVTVHFHLGARVCQGLYETCSDQAESNCVYVDVIAAPLFCQRLRQANDPGLACRVTGLARISVSSGDGSDIHYFAHYPLGRGDFLLCRFPNKRRSGAQDPKRRQEMNVEHRLELFVTSSSE